jgi:hypothetical protein
MEGEAYDRWALNIRRALMQINFLSFLLRTSFEYGNFRNAMVTRKNVPYRISRLPLET